MSSSARQSLRNEPPTEASLVAVLFGSITRTLVSTNVCGASSLKRWSYQHWPSGNALTTSEVYRGFHLWILPTEFPGAPKVCLSNRGCESTSKELSFGSQENSLICRCSQISHLSLPVFRTAPDLLSTSNSCIDHPPFV